MRWFARLLLVALAALGLAAVFGPNLAKDRVAAALSRAAGRPVSVGGLALVPGWPPTFLARDVAAAGIGTVESARVATGSWWAGRIDAAVQDARFTWRDAATGIVAEGTASGRARGEAFDFTVHAVLSSLPAGLGVNEATLDAKIVSGRPLSGTLAGTMRGAPFHVAFETAPPDQVQGLHDLPLTAKGDLAGAAIEMSGRVARPRDPSGVEAMVSVGTDNAEALAGALGLAAPLYGRLAARGKVADGPDGLHHGVSISDAAIDGPTAAGTGDVVVGIDPPRLNGRIAFSRLDLDAILARAIPAAPAPAPAPASVPAAAAALAAPARAIPDRPLPWSMIDRLDAELAFSADTLRLGGADYRQVAGHLAARDGTLAVDPYATTLPGGGVLRGALRLQARASPPAAALVLHATDLDFAKLLAGLALPPWAEGRAILDADLRGAGLATGALAASLDGSASLRLRDGTADGGLLALLLAASRLPLAPGLAGGVRVRCLAIGVRANHGVLGLAPLVADSDRVLIQGSGTIDLGREILALRLRPLLRAGPGVVIPVRVDGPLRAPRFGPDGGGLVLPPVDASVCPGTPPAPPSRKLPKPIDVLRGLLR